MLQAASVLVVDHQPRFVVPLVRSLNDEGAYVAIAPNAREAFNLHRQRPFDVVITNSGLPDASVDVFIRAIRAVHNATFIVVTDGGGLLSTKSDEVGADVIVSKQTAPASLLARLRHWDVKRAA